MDVSNVHFGKRPGSDNGLPQGLDVKQIFFTNLQLLGFDAAAMEMKYKIPFNKDTFNFANKAASEAVLYFLFNRLNPTMCRQEFRDCWPVTDKKSEAAFRKICCIWLQNIQKEESDARLPRINASLFLSPGGDKFYRFLLAFSSYVLLHVVRTEHDSGVLGHPTLTRQNKEMGFVMETTAKCAAVRHRKQFLETLAQTASAKQSWQAYTDETSKQLRSLTRDIRELDRDTRDQIQTAAQKGLARGSPIPASRRPQDFDLSAHTANRAQRVRQVRGLWRELEGYEEGSRESRRIVDSIIDRAQEKVSIDAANIQISIPHLMLRHCEEEMRRRQVDNIYEGGELNLESVLQLWNLALRMYIQRLQHGGLKDLSVEANTIRSQAHSHQAYLANAALLREKMAKQIPQRKKAVDRLRSQFRTEVTTSDPGMSAPSPPVTFDPVRGHSGATPTGPVVHLSPDQTNTPEAATDIANFISQSSQKPWIEPFQSRAFGRASLQNRNQNNSDSSGLRKLPQASQSSTVRGGGGGASRQLTKVSAAGRKQTTAVQPRVVRHISHLPVPQPSSAPKIDQKSASGKGRTGKASSSHPLASTPERGASAQTAPVDKTPLPLDYGDRAAETARQRAHNLLAEEIVRAVMHGEDDEEEGEPLHLWSLASPGSAPPLSAVNASLPSASQQLRQTVGSSSLFSSQDSPTPLTVVESGIKAKTVTPKHPPSSSKMYRVSDDVGERFVRAASPLTLVQQAGMSEAERRDVWRGGDHGRGDAHQGRNRTEGDGGECEAEDGKQKAGSPVGGTLSEEAFVAQDLIYRSPLAMDVSRMWHNIASDGREKKDSSSDKGLAVDWLESDRSSVGSGLHTLTLQASQTSSNSGQDLADTKPSHLASWLSSGQQEVGTPLTTPRINNTLTFVTSFEEDSAANLEPENSTAEWQELLSTVSDDQEVEVNHRSANSRLCDSAAFNPAENKTPVSSFRHVPSTTDSGDKWTLPGDLSSPVISFLPHTPLSVASGGEASQSVGSSGSLGGRNSPVKHTALGGVRFSPEDSSDKENSAVGRFQNFNAAHSPARPTNMDSSARTTEREPSLTLGFSDGASEIGNDLVNSDDFTNASGTSPNDSFTPLRFGLLVEGKSPARSGDSLKKTSNSLFSPNTADVLSPAKPNMESLDEKLAAQLSRLKVLKAKAFQDSDTKEPETSKEADVAVSSLSMLYASSATETGHQEQQSPVLGAEPLDIFGEDDSILLPASP